MISLNDLNIDKLSHDFKVNLAYELHPYTESEQVDETDEDVLEILRRYNVNIEDGRDT